MIKVRYATCTPWPETVGVPPCGDLKLGRWSKPKVSKFPGFKDFEFSLDLESIVERKAARRECVLRAIAEEKEQLRQPYCRDVGLGPHVIWDPFYPCCGYLTTEDSFGWEARQV